MLSETSISNEKRTIEAKKCYGVLLLRVQRMWKISNRYRHYLVLLQKKALLLRGFARLAHFSRITAHCAFAPNITQRAAASMLAAYCL